MRRSLLGLLAVLLLASPLTADDSFLYVIEGRAIANGAPVNNKALKAKYSGSYFWFSIDGKAYLVRDANVLSRIKAIYAPVFDFGWDFPIAEQLSVMKEQLLLGPDPKPGEDLSVTMRRIELKRQQNELAKRANAAAKKVNAYAARVDDMNREIERQLHDLGVQLIASKLAVPVNRDR
ncbi:MAG TPA: hypothetical protein VKB93_27450 [Thermoanaerobaculia bacterium]|nr:hypothetical protein [Thermoanaerobaculia bacterium]